MITTRYTNTHFYADKPKDVSCRRFTLNERSSFATTDESGDEQQHVPRLHHDNKDRFIELAQAALEEAKMEEEQKGVWQELMETLIAHTGAPMMADVILEQFRSQDVIERLAEDHFEEQERRRSSSSSLHDNQELYAPNILKEPASEEQQEDVLACSANASESDVSLDSFSMISNVDQSFNSLDAIMLISEYLWRIFRFLLLASLVGLVYHFMCADPNQPLMKL